LVVVGAGSLEVAPEVKLIERFQPATMLLAAANA